MRISRSACWALAALIAAPTPSWSAEARLEGRLSVEGQGAAALEIRLIRLQDGRVLGARSDASGHFEMPLPVGVYALEAPTGYRIAEGPRIVSVGAGADLQAAVVLASQAFSPLSIDHEPSGCVRAETHSLIDARIEPLEAVQEARVFFRSNRTQEFFHALMIPLQARFRACLPPVLEDAGPVDYYFAAESRAGVFVRTAPFSLAVVTDDESCPQPYRVLPRCPEGFPILDYGGGPPGVLPAGLEGGTRTIAGVVAVGAGVIGIGSLLPGPGPASPSR